MGDGTAEPFSQDQILRREQGQGKNNFPCSADHEQDWQSHTRLIHSAMIAIHAYMWNSALPNADVAGVTATPHNCSYTYTQYPVNCSCTYTYTQLLLHLHSIAANNSDDSSTTDTATTASGYRSCALPCRTTRFSPALGPFQTLATSTHTPPTMPAAVVSSRWFSLALP